MRILTEEEAPQALRLRSQPVIIKSNRGQHRKYLPYAFTQHGALMAANVLKSPRAVAMSVYVIRAFVEMREVIAANAAILKRLAEIDETLLLHDSRLRHFTKSCVPSWNRSRCRRNRRLVSMLKKMGCHTELEGSYGVECLNG